MKKNYEGKYCVIRGDRSGVFAGNGEIIKELKQYYIKK